MQERQFPRFRHDGKLAFRLHYDFTAKIDFKVGPTPLASSQHSYLGFTKNISINGLCFESPKELKPHDKVWIEFHIPDSDALIYMEADVRWSTRISSKDEKIAQYLIGVCVTKIDGMSVEDTIYFDQAYQVMWSQLLDRILGSYAQAHREHK